ncbi:MAG: HlyC/CorC family transporter [Gammaproteobacteria bacterium]|jgi:CBS domain containing-hemolysin-like protein|nr:HlyC/CorC family transporter [Gammaproteobacteria bacterium]
MSQLVLIILAFGFVLLNGFFVAAEFAMVKLRHTRVQALQTTYGWRGRILAKVHAQLDAYLSACQLGITLASLGLGWIGEPAFASLLTPILKLFGVVSAQIIDLISFGVAFSIISFLHIVVGELMPKSMAIRQAERLSLWTAAPLYGFYWLMYPAIYVLNASANLLLKVFKLDAVHHGEQAYSSEELKLILKASHSHGELTQVEADMLEHTLDFADLQIADVMRPVDEMVALDINATLENNLALIMTTRYSRYPVYLTERNHIIGILHIKDLFVANQQPQNLTNLKPLLRPIMRVKPESRALGLFQQFQQGMPHFALVYHRGRVVGFVTLDNLLQVLLGRMKDEFHLTREDGIALKDGSFMVKGYTSIYALEQLLEQDLSMYEVPTMSGLILQQLQRFPQEGETIEFANFSLVVEKIRGQRILQVHVYRR